MTALFQELVAVQREIYLAFADRIGGFAETGDWRLLAAYLPMGIVFGAVHALTPGHSKAILATYVTGSPVGLGRALAASLLLSFVHVAMSVIIVLAALPLVSISFGSVGRASLLEDISRGLLGLVGLWMLWQGIRGNAHAHAGQASFAGFAAGLIPCPLTLFVMTFAMTGGVGVAGIAFAVVMMLGVASVLLTVALLAFLVRWQLLRLFANWPRAFERISRAMVAAAGLVLILVAANALADR